MSTISEVWRKLTAGITTGGKSLLIKSPITTSAGAYSSGDCVGTIQQLKDVVTVVNGTAILKSIQVKDTAAQSAALTILIFDSLPLGATTTDNSAFVWGSGTAFTQEIAKINIAATDYESIDSKSIYDSDAFSQVLKTNGGLDLYYVVITTGTPTYAANSTTLSINFGFLQD
jgi:hypothetical protein